MSLLRFVLMREHKTVYKLSSTATPAQRYGDNWTSMDVMVISFSFLTFNKVYEMV